MMNKLIKGIDDKLIERISIIGVKNKRSANAQILVAMEVFCDLYDSGKIK